MKIALLSDIHANLPALEAVLHSIRERGDIEATVHLGDLVGYAPWPDETVELIREAGIMGVAGNYDSTVATGYAHCGCRYEDPAQETLSHRSYAWTLEHTSPGTKRWLGTLPFRLDLRPLGGHRSGPTLVLVHGAPTLNTLYWTEDRSDDFCLRMAERVAARTGDLLAFGHTHLPWHRLVDGIHFVNTGSVGRPKDGDWRAGYVVVTVEEGGGKGEVAAPQPGTGGSVTAVEFVRVDYDLARARAAILESGLPDAFAGYLATGGNPPPVSAPPAG